MPCALLISPHEPNFLAWETEFKDLKGAGTPGSAVTSTLGHLMEATLLPRPLLPGVVSGSGLFYSDGLKYLDSFSLGSLCLLRSFCHGDALVSHSTPPQDKLQFAQKVGSAVHGDTPPVNSEDSKL